MAKSSGFFIVLLFLLFPLGAPAQSASLEGTVTLERNGRPVPSASVTLIQLGRSTMTDAEGRYLFADLPPGEVDVVSHMHALTGPVKKIRIESGERARVDFTLALSPVRHEITVTATGREETAFNALQSVTTVSSLRLVEQGSFGLGDTIAGESGVHKRSFGPGSSRPVVRGFDGDRVLILNDGLPTGTLSSQSGEHAEPVDAPNLDRVEVVKGPATLLYGSSAIGGVVNMVTAHHLLHEHPHPGFRGQLTASGAGNTNAAAAHAGVEYGHGNWLVWSSASRQVAGDYDSPSGRVDNSKTRSSAGSAGLGWHSDGPFFNLSYAFNRGRLGIPFAGAFHHHHEEGEAEDELPDPEEDAPQVDETFSWQNVRLNAGTRRPGSILEEVKVAAALSRWMHKEVEGESTATAFDNKLFHLRATVRQRHAGGLEGTSGLQFSRRDYRAEGEEALSPPARGNTFALFTLQEVDISSARLQFGGRLEHTGYSPSGLPRRSFTGFSGAAGIRLPLGKQMAAVAHYTHSYRAPALEELYNHGPHIGNLAFEIGDRDLKRERADGIDLSLRGESARLEMRTDFYYYRIRDFIYLDFTGSWAHGLREARFAQQDARFVGGEVSLAAALRQGVWLTGALDVVNAGLAASGDPLPRIPPLRGKIGIDARWGTLSFRPELVMAGAQERLGPTETRTPGYAVLNLAGSFTLVRSNRMHVVSLGVSNAADRLYRNHLSFIKDLAPEMGRSVRASYILRFF